MLLCRVGRFTAVAESLPPADAPTECKQNVSEFVEEAEVSFVGDLLPFDVVEVAFEFAETFDFKHAAEDPGELSCEKNFAAI